MTCTKRITATTPANPTHLRHLLAIVPGAKARREFFRELHTRLCAGHDGHDWGWLGAQFVQGVGDGAVLVGVQVVVLDEQGRVDGARLTGVGWVGGGG